MTLLESRNPALVLLQVQEKDPLPPTPFVATDSEQPEDSSDA